MEKDVVSNEELLPISEMSFVEDTVFQDNGTRQGSCACEGSLSHFLKNPIYENIYIGVLNGV